MATPWMAATTGFGEASTTRMTACRDGSADHLGRAELADVGAAGEGLAGPGEHDRLDGGIGGGAVEPLYDAAPQLVPEAVDGRVVQSDHGDAGARRVSGQCHRRDRRPGAPPASMA